MLSKKLRTSSCWCHKFPSLSDKQAKSSGAPRSLARSGGPLKFVTVDKSVTRIANCENMWPKRWGWVSAEVSASHYGMPFSMKEDHKKIKKNKQQTLHPKHDATRHATVQEKVTLRKVVYQ